MAQLIGEIWNLVRRLWHTGNVWMRWAILLFGGWPIVLWSFAFLGMPLLTATIALAVPVIAIFLVILAVFDPAIVAVIGGDGDTGKRAIQWVVIALAMQFVVGVYLWLVPVASARGLMVPLALVAIVLFLFAIAVPGDAESFARRMKKAAIVGFSLITAVFFLYHLLPRTAEKVEALPKFIDSKVSAILDTANQTPSQAMAGQLMPPTRTVTVIAPVGRWSENFSVPPNTRFRIIPRGKITVKTWDNRELNVDEKPGEPIWLGKDILDSNFKFMSRDTSQVPVEIVLQPAPV